jgi:hypothetical protein
MDDIAKKQSHSFWMNEKGVSKAYPTEECLESASKQAC